MRDRSRIQLQANPTMLQLLGIVGLKAKDIIDFAAMQFAVHFPLALILGAVMMTTFTCVPPNEPFKARP